VQDVLEMMEIQEMMEAPDMPEVVDNTTTSSVPCLLMAKMEVKK
jgi:hypothetical protein